MDPEADFLSFYGLQEKKEKDPDDMNDSGFQAELYFKKKVQKSSHAEVTKLEETLKKDIKTLDQAHQSLVYDNYTKFIQAEDSIKKLTQGLGFLQEKMQALLQNLEVVSTESTFISQKLNPNHEKIKRLLGIDRLLKRIQTVSQLPTKLKACYDLQEYDSVVDMWLVAEKVLLTQTHYESFESIKKQCKAIIEDLEVKVHAQMLDPSLGSVQAIKSAQVLIKLQKNPKKDSEKILSQLIACRTDLIIKKIGLLPPSKEASELLKMIDVGVVQEMLEFMNAYRISLLPFSKPLSFDNQSDNFLKQMRSKVFHQILKYFPSEAICSLEPDVFTSFLLSFNESVGKIAFVTDFDDGTEYFLRAFIPYQFEDLCKQVLSEVKTRDFSELCLSTKKKFLYLFGKFDKLSQKIPKSISLITSSSSSYITNLINTLSQTDDASLNAFGLAQHFGDQLLNVILGQVFRLDSSQKEAMETLEKELRLDCSSNAQKCLQTYIKTKRELLSNFFQVGICDTNWFEIRMPNGVSVFTNLVIQEINQMFNAVKDVVKSTKDSSMSSAGSRAQKSRVSAFSGNSTGAPVPILWGREGGSVSHIDILFNSPNRLGLGKKPELETKSIVTSVVLFSLKSMLEYLRTQSFSANGFNQIQVDAFFLFQTLIDKVTSSSLLLALINEILTTTMERSINPIVMKYPVLTKLYSDYASPQSSVSTNSPK